MQATTKDRALAEEEPLPPPPEDEDCYYDDDSSSVDEGMVRAWHSNYSRSRNADAGPSTSLNFCMTMNKFPARGTCDALNVPACEFMDVGKFLQFFVQVRPADARENSRDVFCAF